VESTDTPNVLLVVCDQLTPFLTGVYGHPVVQTPHLTTLARNGIRFDAAYTSYPVCVPARASLMTGQYASKVECFDNAAPFACDVPTVAHYLAAAGFATALSGKMHFVGPDQLHGFEQRLTTDIYPSNFAWLPQREQVGTFRHVPDAKPIAIDYVTAGVRQWSDGLEFDELTHQQALRYLRQRRTQPGGSEQLPTRSRDQRPFFLCVSYHHPHEPFHPTQEMWDRYDGADIDIPDLSQTYPRSTMDDWVDAMHGVADVDLANEHHLRDLRRAYYALVSYVDDKVGELLATLDECGLRNDTVVIFTSDHGDMLGERGMVQKRVFYEWSSRIPLVIQLPNVRRGETVDTPVSILDIVPTILELAGVTAATPMHGTNLLATDDSHGRTVCGEFHSEGVYAPCFMVRQGPYKLIEVHGHGHQLFNLADDPDERHDLIASGRHRDVADELLGALHQHFDPDDIERRIRASLARRRVVRDGMRATATHWDYSPTEDATKQYWRFD
jgi:choline-sulfatase